MFSLTALSLAVWVAVMSSVNSGPAVRKLEKRQDYYQPQYYQPQYPQVHTAVRPLRQKEKEEHQDLSKVPGQPGVDYPLYHSVPQTNFDCSKVPAVPGMYVDVESGCQAYHVCQEDREHYHGGSFLCTNGTLFNQKEFTCDWWYNVNCHEQPQFYSLNLDPVKNPYAPKPQHQEEQHLGGHEQPEVYPAYRF